MITSAVFSKDTLGPDGRGMYRYELRRAWAPELGLVAFCGLNPSTADENTDDPTIRRELDFAQRWGFGGIVKVNAYALRSTDPKGLWLVADPKGPEADHWIGQSAIEAKRFVVCWGNNCTLRRQAEVRSLLDSVESAKPHAFRVTKKGRPEHPLYLKRTSTLAPWP